MQQTKKYFSTPELANLIDYSLQSIYNRVSKHGHFHGVTPTKAPNSRLIWPAHEVTRLADLLGAK